jgi:hypothetical protein
MPQNVSDFEEEFERALATYADPSDAGHPRVLAARVTTAIDTQRQRRRRWMGISVAVPGLVCLLVVALVHIRRPVEPAHRAAGLTAIPSLPRSMTVPSMAAPTAKPHMEAARHEIVRNEPRRLPKLDQFPATTPATEQERLLVQFFAYAPPSTQQLVARAQRQSDEPLRIAELHIPFLDSGTQP